MMVVVSASLPVQIEPLGLLVAGALAGDSFLPIALANRRVKGQARVAIEAGCR